MTTYYLKDANGNLVPVNSTPIGSQPGAASISTVNASDALAEPGGAPVTGAAMPAGGAGLTGWLSAIYAKLTGALTVSWAGQSVGISGQLPGFAAAPTVNLGTLNGAATAANQPALNGDGGALAHVTNFPATQAISAAALPLPSGAATSALQNSILTALAGPLETNIYVGGSAASASNPVPICDAYQPAQSASWTSATGANTAMTLNTAGYDTVIFTIAVPAGLTAGAISFEVYDGTNWIPLKAPRTDSYYTDTVFALSGSPGTHSWQLPVAGYPQTRARLSTVIAGAGTVGLVGIVSSAPDVSLVTVGIDPNSTLPPFAVAPTVSDAQSAPFAGAVAMTIGTTYAAQRSVGVLATTAGNVQFQFPDTSTVTLPVAVGWQTFPYACTQIVAAGTTATATYCNLK